MTVSIVICLIMLFIAALIFLAVIKYVVQRLLYRFIVSDVILCKTYDVFTYYVYMDV